MRRYQIIRKPKKGTAERPARWSFVAHGAPYDESEALAMRDRIEQGGELVRLLRI
jgi:hypothetical protein